MGRNISVLLLKVTQRPSGSLSKRNGLFYSVESAPTEHSHLLSWRFSHSTSLSITNSWSLLKLMSIESVMPSNHLILCHSLFLLPSVFPSIRVVSTEPWGSGAQPSTGSPQQRAALGCFQGLRVNTKPLSHFFIFA